MSFTDIFRKTYRDTRKCVEADDCAGAILGCRKLAALCGKQYKLNDGAKLQLKATLKQHAGNFASSANTIECFGITNQVKTFFGFEEIDLAPNTTQKSVVVAFDPTDPVDFAIGEISVTEKPEKPSETSMPHEANTPQAPIDLPSDTTAPSAVVGAEGNGTETGNPMPAFDPENLEDFIGQREIVKRIKLEIMAAKKLGRQHINPMLLLGSRGLGKTTLMKLVAKELGVRFEYMDCSQLRNDVSSHKAVQNFFQGIGKTKEPVVIGMDEIHALPNKLQTGLLTLLNDREFVYLDNSGTNHNIPIEHFTFIGATTDAQDVLATLKDRCGLTFYLLDYSRDELRRIFLNKFASKQLQISEDTLVECINRCRSSLREVNAIVSGLETLAVIADTDSVNAEMTAEHFRNAGIDPIGLKTKDVEILNILLEDDTGVMAEDTIAKRAGLDSKIYSSEYEPYLIKIGFISISGKGRSLTEKAKAYLIDGTYEYGEPDITDGQSNGGDSENGDDIFDPMDDLI